MAFFAPIFVSVVFHGDHKTVTELKLIWPPSVLGIFTDLRLPFMSVLSACIMHAKILLKLD